MRQSTNNNSSLNLVTSLDPLSPVTEAYRVLRTNIQFSSIDRPIHVIMISSAQRGEGKTTTVSNLAVAYAQEGKKVLLIDTDLRDPSLHHVFSLPNRVGLTSILSNQYGLQEVVRDTVVDNLSVITGGPIPPNPSEMLGSFKMQSLIDELRTEYDMILIDTPPVLAVTDGIVISVLCDGVIMVVDAGKVDKERVKKAKSSLEHANARILGAVLNKMNKKDRKTAINYYG
ncbi:CpsD/CapB family tyrosine-protein kinase [Paenibacillus spongiae]|uniref:non-specific protein-tyrosine kinase n=1 Tax=Paenibacillus spongiae TaxID=2909671 RepID=A0ABY5SH72_9BACL|nr:CpsD/CapB family tyrosine-protein kinase [Paenibacillus spongiae]UVI31603.1 CpsD/CapB family tyrosine-protein kinase [Paenibacillus spongiae]